MLITMKRTDGKTFYLRDGIWTETGLESLNPDVEIEFLSSQYFQFLKNHTDLNKILAVGEMVKFRWDGKVYLITDSENERN